MKNKDRETLYQGQEVSKVEFENRYNIIGVSYSRIVEEVSKLIEKEF